MALLALVATSLLTSEWPGRKLNVALHAQSNYALHGFVAGSEITTNGLRRAFSKLPEVGATHVFAPYAYDGLYAHHWDLALIEGWTGPVPFFIHALRRSNPLVVILYVCLDTYPNLKVIGRLDVDGYLTNSQQLSNALARLAPTSIMHLGADLDTMYPIRPRLPQYMHNVTYLGSVSSTKHHLREMLLAAAPFGLAIYGVGWDSLEAGSEVS
jgi:hypothetical protein